MVGNDVVDLADPELGSGARHPRFDLRVFAPVERRVIDGAGEPNRMRWILWAAKEAAYKLARKLDPETAFAPARFVVRLDETFAGTVGHAGRELDVRVCAEGSAVHAIATDDPARRSRITSALEATDEPLQASAAVRALAIRTLARRLGIPAAELSIGSRARIPFGEVRGSARRVDLSLSHHGRFVAVACDPGGHAR